MTDQQFLDLLTRTLTAAQAGDTTSVSALAYRMLIDHAHAHDRRTVELTITDNHAAGAIKMTVTVLMDVVAPEGVGK